MFVYDPRRKFEEGKRGSNCNTIIENSVKHSIELYFSGNQFDLLSYYTYFTVYNEDYVCV